MARMRITLGLAGLLTVTVVYTHSAAAAALRELLQQAPVGTASGYSGPVDATFEALPPVPVEDSDFFIHAIFTVPETSIASAGPAPPVALDLPPEAALGPQTFTDPANAQAYAVIQEASIVTHAEADAMATINDQERPQMDEIYTAAQSVNIAGLASIIRTVAASPYDNQEFQQDIQNCAAQWEAVLRSAGNAPTQIGPWVALPANADPITLNQMQLWQYYYNTLVVPALTALTDYLANPADATYQQAFTAAAALTSGSGSGGQPWTVPLAPAQLVNYMAVVTNPAGSCATAPTVNRAADGATMCLYQNSAGLGSLLEYDRHNYVFIAQELIASALLTAEVAAACEGIVNARLNGGDQTTYQLNILTYKSWYQETVNNIYGYYNDMATYFWNNQFRKDVASAINVGIDGLINSAEVTQNLLGFLNEKYDFLVWNGFVFTAPGLYTPADGQVWAQVGGCMAGRVGIDTLWVPFNPTTCSTEGGSIYYPNYPLKNGTNIGYMLFFNAAGEVNPLPGDNSKITGIVQGCQGSTGGDPKFIVDCVSAAYPNRGIIALKPGNNVPDPSAYAAGSYAPYMFFSNLAASGNDQTGTTLALLPQS